MTAARLPDAARAIGALSGAEATELAGRAAHADDADAVRALLEPAPPVTAEPLDGDGDGDGDGGGWSVTVTVADPEGLHARPAAQLVATAQRFASEITLDVAGRRAAAKAMLAVLGLGADRGSEVRIEARGADAREAVTALGAQLAVAP